jgi:hypothetical protein
VISTECTTDDNGTLIGGVDGVIELQGGSLGATFQPTINGAPVGDPIVVAANDSYEYPLSFTEDQYGGSVVVDVTIGGGEISLLGNVTVNTDCLTTIPTPPAPVVTSKCGVADSAPVLPTSEDYTASYSPAIDGPGNYQEVITAANGDTFATGLSVSYPFTLNAAVPCPTSSPTPPTTPASNGGAETGMSGKQPVAQAATATRTTSTSPILGVFGAALVLAVLIGGAYFIVRNKRRGEAGAK